jgi:hypothetical protein
MTNKKQKTIIKVSKTAHLVLGNSSTAIEVGNILLSQLGSLSVT